MVIKFKVEIDDELRDYLRTICDYINKNNNKINNTIENNKGVDEKNLPLNENKNNKNNNKINKINNINNSTKIELKQDIKELENNSINITEIQELVAKAIKQGLLKNVQALLKEYSANNVVELDKTDYDGFYEKIEKLLK